LAGTLQTIHLDETVEAEQATAFEITKTIRSVRARYLQPKDRPEGTVHPYMVLSLAGCHLDSMCEVRVNLFSCLIDSFFAIGPGG
jgi:hypothetical protein